MNTLFSCLNNAHVRLEVSRGHDACGKRELNRAVKAGPDVANLSNPEVPRVSLLQLPCRRSRQARKPFPATRPPVCGSAWAHAPAAFPGHGWEMDTPAAGIF
jgi:hypothetical protein